MNAVRKRGRQMASIKGVMLLPLDAESYRRHMAHHKTSGICVSLIPGSALCEWLPTDSEGDTV